METLAKHLATAATVPSSPTAVGQTTTSNQQVRDLILSYLAQKDYTLPKYFERGYALSAPTKSFEETIQAIQSNIRSHLIDRAAKNEETYAHQALIINKVFANVQNLMELLISNGVIFEKNELVVSLIGNLLKSLV